MLEQKVEITSESGLHARPAALLVKEAGRFQSRLTMGKAGKEVDLKSILGVMSLAVSHGETVVLKADGSDEREALEHLVQFCANLS